MNLLSRLIVLLAIYISFTAPLGAAVVMDVYVDGYCGVIAADDDKKSDGDKKTEAGEDEEPECD